MPGRNRLPRDWALGRLDATFTSARICLQLIAKVPQTPTLKSGQTTKIKSGHLLLKITVTPYSSPQLRFTTTSQLPLKPRRLSWTFGTKMRGCLIPTISLAGLWFSSKTQPVPKTTQSQNQSGTTWSWVSQTQNLQLVKFSVRSQSWLTTTDSKSLLSIWT